MFKNLTNFNAGSIVLYYAGHGEIQTYLFLYLVYKFTVLGEDDSDRNGNDVGLKSTVLFMGFNIYYYSAV
jgi:hypothetical protein